MDTVKRQCKVLKALKLVGPKLSGKTSKLNYCQQQLNSQISLTSTAPPCQCPHGPTCPHVLESAAMGKLASSHFPRFPFHAARFLCSG